ncbi:MAG: hypothetical protein ACFE7R_08575, partial [Candidatus Hodarchaeota archaeon]
PPIPLTGSLTTVSILRAELDQDIVRVGFLRSERITGEVVISGYAFAERVYLRLRPEVGSEIEVTLSGTDGVYEIDLSPSNLAPGEYEVFAGVTSQDLETVEVQMSSLQIIQDNTMLIVMVVGIIIIAVIGFAVKKIGKK